MVLGYGIGRSSAHGMQELRNVVFATVAQPAVRKISADVYSHILSLDLDFHLNRQTGAVTRVLDRGARSITFVLQSMVFNVVPLSLELALVCGILTHKLVRKRGMGNHLHSERLGNATCVKKGLCPA